MNTLNDTTQDDLLNAYPRWRESLERMFASIRNLPQEDQAIILRTLARYEKESKSRSYKTDPGKLAQFILDKQLLNDSRQLVDLGAGPGDLLKRIGNMERYGRGRLYMGIRLRGLDVCPGFAEDFNAQADLGTRMDVGLIDSPFQDGDFDLDTMQDSSVVSILTLDRLTNPRVLIENMGRFNRAKVLATLLPVVPEDDNPSRQDEEQKIIYTRPENRIVPGKTPEEDREVLLYMLERSWGRGVQVENVNYTVQSSGDTQKYDLAVFYAQ